MKPDQQLPEETIQVQGLYERWFLDYASYVILERAVPAIEDGLKPVQRRILHALNEVDDGRFNKLANIIGQTMQFHPHGDASIGDALVALGQKDLLLDMQGNWGDIRTGDSAAAARYIETRLSKFAKAIVFNNQTTTWQLSYDGRKKEPVTLPVKFPLLLGQGVDGIAVGLSTKILPHNFIELIEASIDAVQDKPFNLLPDFQTGGYMDPSQYNEGQRGGRVKVRARIEEVDKKMLVVKDIPFSTTTGSLIESIIKANDAGKIKIKKVIDNTAKDVEIQIHLAPGVSPDVTIDALYAFTECEVSLSPNACVIVEDKPMFLSVNEILRIATQNTIKLLKRELEIRIAELKEKLLFSSLEKIFIENRVYRDIEECETFEAVIRTIDAGLQPYKPLFYREITDDDIVRLTEIRIKRISKYDGFKAEELMRSLESELEESQHNLLHIKPYTINYYRDLLKQFGKGRERKTEIRAFDTIVASSVVANNQKLYVNREEGFIGYGIKKDEYVCDCSDIDDVIAFRRDGTYKIVKVDEKVFIGKDILYVHVFRKNDDRLVFNTIYQDGETGFSYVKRFQVQGVTRDKEYTTTRGTKGSKITYFSANLNGEAETVSVQLSLASKAKIKIFDYDFSTLDIKNRTAQGNILTKYSVKKIVLKQQGFSTLGSISIYYDKNIGRLNTDGRGDFLGTFNQNDSILVLTKDGQYELTDYKLTNRYEPKDVIALAKNSEDQTISCAYFDAQNKIYYLKRFKIETTTLDKKFPFIPLENGAILSCATLQANIVFEVTHKVGKEEKKSEVEVDEVVDVRGWKALGAKLSYQNVKLITIKE